MNDGHVDMTVANPVAIAPEALPDPWLVDSEFLLTELARVRELALRVPLHQNTILPVNSIVDAIWRLEEQLRYLLRLHRDGQNAFAKKALTLAKQQTAIPKRVLRRPERKVVGIGA